ncbi:unnamed protein product [Calicophoron daubneyi]|uniref:Thioredoxin domain-containing protein n=1 Tax=Calicophoron daubneyi TaxID=300641 RepID=A0AAV2TG83_CALDB
MVRLILAACFLLTLSGYYAQSQEKIVCELVMYHSPRCRCCIRFMPKFDQLARDPTLNSVRFEKIDCLANREACSGIRYYPTVMLYVNGRLYKQYENYDDIMLPDGEFRKDLNTIYSSKAAL